jgi:hypothetical protein
MNAQKIWAFSASFSNSLNNVENETLKIFMKKILSTILLAIMFLGTFVPPVLAVNPQDEFRKSVKKAKLVSEEGGFPTISTATGSILQALLAFIGTVVLIIVIYAGFLWATAAGNEAKVKQAKGMLLGALIGLTIIISSAYLVGFVVDLLASATTRSTR